MRPLNGTTNCGSGVGADGAAWEGCGSAFDVDAGLGCGGRAARGGVGGVFAVVLAGFFVGIAVEAAGGVGGEAFFDVEVNAINDAADGFFLAFAGGGGAGGDGAGRDVGAGEGLDDAGSELGHVGVSTRRAAGLQGLAQKPLDSRYRPLADVSLCGLECGFWYYGVC